MLISSRSTGASLFRLQGNIRIQDSSSRYFGDCETLDLENPGFIKFSCHPPPPKHPHPAPKLAPEDLSQIMHSFTFRIPRVGREKVRREVAIYEIPGFLAHSALARQTEAYSLDAPLMFIQLVTLQLVKHILPLL